MINIGDIINLELFIAIPAGIGIRKEIQIRVTEDGYEFVGAARSPPGDSFSSSSGTAPNAASNPEDKNISDKKENVDIVAEVVLALLEKYNKIENIPDDELDGAVQEIVNYWEAKTSPDELARYQNDPGTLSINMKKPENNCRRSFIS